MSHQWKAAERFIAKALGGHRIPRGANFSNSLPDIVAPASNTLARATGLIFAESKYSKNNFWVYNMKEHYLSDRSVVKFIEDKTNKQYLFFELRDIHKLSDPKIIAQSFVVYSSKFPKYIVEHFDQSKDYIDIVKKDPITTASITSMTNISPFYSPVLPIVVLTKARKSFRLAYTDCEYLLTFYTQQDDRSYRNI